MKDNVEVPLRETNTEEDLVDVNLVRALNDALIEISKEYQIDNHKVLAQTIATLVELGANVNIYDSDGLTPLIHAIHAKNPNSIKAILACNGDINFQDRNGWTPVMHATNKKQTKLIDYLIQKGADIKITNNDGLSCLELAHLNGFDALHTHLSNQLELSNPEAGSKIWDFFNAINSKNSDLVTQSIANGINVNSLDENGHVALSRAITTDHYSNVLKLLRSGANVNLEDASGLSPIHYAVRSGSTIILSLLKLHKVDLEKQDPDGRCPLSIAIMNGCEDIITSLLQEKYNLNITDKNGKTPLIFAQEAGNKRLASLLRYLGANNEQTVENGFLPLVDNDRIQTFIELRSNYLKDIILHALKQDQLVIFDDDSDAFRTAKTVLMESGLFQSESDFNHFVDYSPIRVILSLSYSQDSFGFHPSNVALIVQNLLADAQDLDKKDEILTILEACRTGDKISLPNNTSAKILEPAFDSHAAYFIAKYNDKNEPVTLYYCDGNNGYIIGNSKRNHEYTSGVISMNIDPEKIAAFASQGIDWEQHLVNMDNSYKSYMKDHGRKLLTLFGEVATFKDNGKIELATSIPTQEQERGNCSLKSINILIRKMLNLMDKAMVFKLDESGQPSGAGADIYKEYKTHIKLKPIEKTIEFISTHDNKDDFSYKLMNRFLDKTIMPKATAKNDEKILQKLHILARENSPASITTQLDFEAIQPTLGTDRNMPS